MNFIDTRPNDNNMNNNNYAAEDVQTMMPYSFSDLEFIIPNNQVAASDASLAAQQIHDAQASILEQQQQHQQQQQQQQQQMLCNGVYTNANTDMGADIQMFPMLPGPFDNGMLPLAEEDGISHTDSGEVFHGSLHTGNGDSRGLSPSLSLNHSRPAPATTIEVKRAATPRKVTKKAAAVAAKKAAVTKATSAKGTKKGKAEAAALASNANTKQTITKEYRAANEARRRNMFNDRLAFIKQLIFNPDEAADDTISKVLILERAIEVIQSTKRV